jgi:hypothetical protein
MRKAINIIKQFFTPAHKHVAGKRYYSEDLRDVKFDVEPETLEGILQYKIKWYPTLYSGEEAREKALSHLFFANGGGYSWDNIGIRRCHVEEDVDSTVIERRLRMYENREKKEIIERIESTKEDIKSYTEELEEIDKSDKNRINWYNYVTNKIENDKKDLIRYEKYAKKFDPHFNLFDPKNDPIDKLPRDIHNFKIEHIPGNVQEDYLEGLREIISFYCQKRFSKCEKYKEVVELYKNFKATYPKSK